jgi:homocysteine S-methyltransferase
MRSGVRDEEARTGAAGLATGLHGEPVARVIADAVPDPYANPLAGMRVLDGGMASELEYRGADIGGPLWSAHVLEREPEKIVEVHRAYLEAGAECLLTASYQVSRRGYQEFGLSAAQADGALLRSVELARRAAEGFPSRKVKVAASLGPYGAALHNGAEYHGNYDCTFDDLVQFHRERIAVLAGPDLLVPDSPAPDFLAFETLPSLEEARAIGVALEPWPHLAAWFCFTCRDGRRLAHGELLRDCARLAAGFPQTVAVGVNCTHPRWVTSLIGELREGSGKPIVVYPNSGEEWEATERRWTGSGDSAGYGDLAGEWFLAGAQIVGGCCRTRPEHIRNVADQRVCPLRG